MRNLGPAIKVGVTTIATLAMAYWAFLMLAKGTCGTEPERLTVHGYFRDATLLVEKSRVQISGLNIGHIQSRELNVRPPRRDLVRSKRFAKITVSLDKGVVLYTNAVMSKRSASLLGEFYLEIDPGTYEWWEDPSGQPRRQACAGCKRHVGETLKDGDEVPFIGEAATAPKLVQQISELIPEVRGLASDVRKFIQGPLQKIGDNLNEGVNENRKELLAIMQNINAITRDVRGITRGTDQDVHQIIEDIKVITANVRSLVGEGREDMKEVGSDMRKGLGKLSSAIDKLDRSLGNVEDVTEDLKEGKGTVGRLLKDETLINDVEEVVQDAGALVKSIVGLQTYVGLRSEYNFAAGTIKTYLTVELRPRPDKYYLIELIDDPRGRRTLTTEVTRSDDPSRPVLTREERVTVTDAFRLSFQFAKRINAFTFRFGIKESTGGIGTDIHLFDDRISLVTDLFDFQANIFPRLKAMVAWEFFKRLYVVGGVDDVFNDRPLDGTGGGRDYFLGGQIRFNDEDLRQLLLFGGSALGGSTK